MADTYPRQQARTRSFRLGVPGSYAIAPDGSRIAFTRSTSGTDPINRLMVVDLGSPTLAERIAADPEVLLSGGNEELSAQERARRERLRETTAGITSYATDHDVSRASFALSGQLGLADLTSNNAVLYSVSGAAIDPRLSPDGSHVAWVSERAVSVADVDAGLKVSNQRMLAAPESETSYWGMANFLAAEEFDRIRGYWWSPQSDRLLVENYDEAPVAQWWIADPSTPQNPASSIRYPAAGTKNPLVSLWLCDLDGNKTEVRWDRNRYEYLVSVRWNSRGVPLICVLDRPQQEMLVLGVDVQTGATTVLQTIGDNAWVEMVDGTPDWSAAGELILPGFPSDGSAIHLFAGDRLLMPAGVNVRGVLDVNDDGIVVSVNETPTESQVWHVANDGAIRKLSVGGWNVAIREGSTMVIASSSVDSLTTNRRVARWAVGDNQPEIVGDIESRGEAPMVDLNLELVELGERKLASVVQWPAGHVPGSRKLPVIMNPYGGPHAQRVLEAGRMFATTQWMADLGFCVIVTDGRGSPGRGPSWEREIYGDLATAPLDDQVAALSAAAARWPDDIDGDRVGITGWSFGGYLAALAVLRRPDVFKAAVAGAPVTDWRLYDTAYTERYLGNPDVNPANYESTSLLPLAKDLERPLMIIHGMADDNVVVAHSLQLSSALTAAGRPHTFVPLSNVTHMTPQEEIAENLLNLQVDFFRTHL